MAKFDIVTRAVATLPSEKRGCSTAAVFSPLHGPDLRSGSQESSHFHSLELRRRNSRSSRPSGCRCGLGSLFPFRWSGPPATPLRPLALRGSAVPAGPPRAVQSLCPAQRQSPFQFGLAQLGFLYPGHCFSPIENAQSCQLVIGGIS